MPKWFTYARAAKFAASAIVGALIAVGVLEPEWSQIFATATDP